MLTFEKHFWDKGIKRLAGVDEAGRGPLAGPVTAAAVVFPRALLEKEVLDRLAELTDSKQLSVAQRESFFTLLQTMPDVEIGIGMADVSEIDRYNILKATHMAMRRALLNLPALPENTLIDGLPAPDMPAPSTALVKGDSRSITIAAASVIAKVTRDHLMDALDDRYPEYGFKQHKGYGTADHIQALLRYGPTIHHRRSFRPVREIEAIHSGVKREMAELHPKTIRRQNGRAAKTSVIEQTLPGFLG